MQSTPSKAKVATSSKATAGAKGDAPAENGKGRGKGKKWILPCVLGCGLFFALSSCGAIGFIASIAIPNFKEAREKANRRACFANQKTLTGALEMYHLDYNVPIKRLDRKMLETLQLDGYLRSIPDDPGQGEGSSDNYSLVRTLGPSGEERWTVYCKVHGFISPPGDSSYRDSPREQLEALEGKIIHHLEQEQD